MSDPVLFRDAGVASVRSTEDSRVSMDHLSLVITAD